MSVRIALLCFLVFFAVGQSGMACPCPQCVGLGTVKEGEMVLFTPISTECNETGVAQPIAITIQIAVPANTFNTETCICDEKWGQPFRKQCESVLVPDGYRAVWTGAYLDLETTYEDNGCCKYDWHVTGEGSCGTGVAVMCAI